MGVAVIRDIDDAMKLSGETDEAASAVMLCVHCGAETLPRDSAGRLTAEGREMLGDLVMYGLLDDAAWRVVNGATGIQQVREEQTS